MNAVRLLQAGVLTMSTAAITVTAAVLTVTASLATSAAGRAVDAGLLPEIALRAYMRAEELAPHLDHGCIVRWQILAGIARVESDHGRYGGATTRADGTVHPPIIGIALDGSSGVARLTDTDDGDLDHDPVWDRAVGPFQFIPSSWRIFGRDANADGRADPHNLFDAAAAAARHLCMSAPGDYTDRTRLSKALLAYNRSRAYVEHVLHWIEVYDRLGSGPAVSGGYALPVDRVHVTPTRLRAPHHDYPAWDLPIAEGTAIYAIRGGIARLTTPARSRCGIGVVIDATDGFTYSYCHGSELLVNIGDHVLVGQPIMLSGDTGNSTGPHLHLGLEDGNGALRCPQDLLLAIYQGHTPDPATTPTQGCWT